MARRLSNPADPLADAKFPVTEAEWAAWRREQLGGLPPLIDKGLPAVLLPYQQAILRATAANPLVALDKSRRIGATWGVGADAVLTSGAAKAAGGMDTLYIGYNLDMAREMIDCCAMWARAFGQACSVVGDTLFIEEGEKGERNAIKAFRITFASGFEIVALSSKPRSLRGRQGYVILDEFAFHDGALELLKAALALLIWGGKVLVISTHNGADNPYNTLINDIRAGRRPGVVVRCTFDDAIAQGLYRRICLVKGREWSPEAEAAWRQSIYDFYGAGADEELRCIPSQSGGRYLPRVLIESCADAAVPVARFTAPESFVDRPEPVRKLVVDAWIAAEIAPHLDRINPRWMSALGGDVGRSGDLSVFWPVQIDDKLRRVPPFVVELRACPFDQQRQILWWLIDQLPRFQMAALDARGLGAHLAELTRQRYGAGRVIEVMATEAWYLEVMPPFKAAFEDRSIVVPADAEIVADIATFELINGVPKLPTKRTTGQSGKRHGDAGVGALMAHYASRQDPPTYDYVPVGRQPDRRGGGDDNDDYADPLAGWGGSIGSIKGW
jgi:phage FluMu gp28-like protein